MLRVVTFEMGGLARSEGARGDDQEVLRLHHGDPLLGLRPPGLDGDLLETLDGLGQVALLGLEDRGGLELGVSGRLAVGELAGERLPGGDRLVESLLVLEARRRSGRGSPARARPADSGRRTRDQAARASANRPRSSVVGGDQELGIEDRALGIGALGTVGEPGQVALPGGDGLGESLLPLEDLADLERGGHRELGPVPTRLVGLDLEAVLLEEPR